MGADKALIRLDPDGPTLGELVIARLRAVADDVMVVAPQRPGYEIFGARLVDERHPGAGGVGGIASALHAAEFEHCIVVGCDAPFLSTPLLRWLAETAVAGDIDVTIPRLPGESRQGGRFVYQTLKAVYGRFCLTPIELALEADDRRIVGFFPRVGVLAVDEPTVRRFDPGLRSFLDLNTPEALEAARSGRRD
jgi:molybdenum cofactor guanylyltransferase